VYWTGSQGLVATDVVWTVAPVVPWLVGRVIRQRRTLAAAAAAVDSAEREREQARLAALEQERGRMARELHDILAHSVSLMGIQAGAAEQVLGSDPERARPVLQSIQQTSRDSVSELHRLLGILRADELDSDRAPQPRLDELAGLIERMCGAGLPIELQIEGTVQPLAPGIELTAYRVAQEALTNVLKHARPSHVAVVVRYGVDDLHIVIDNDGVVAGSYGAGHGLIGMNERVLVYGGRLVVGERPGGRFQVDAQIPLRGEAG
jgi:signal transduction histidine kinase